MSTARHDDKEKLELQWILAMGGLDDVARVGMYGAKKYSQSNWRGGSEWMRFAGSCVRHLSRFIRGESLDSESGLPHLAHCAYNCLILLTWAQEGKGTDDRPKAFKSDGLSKADNRYGMDIVVLMPYGYRVTKTHLDIGSGDCEIIE